MTQTRHSCAGALPCSDQVEEADLDVLLVRLPVIAAERG